MPRVSIEVRKQYPPEQEVALIDAVHSALCEAFKIRPNDKNVRLVVHEPHRFGVPPDRAQPAAYTQVCAIVRNLEPFGIPPDHVHILLREAPLENWGIRGGQAACDVDLGFEVKI